MTDLAVVRQAVAECFASDRELIERWHIAAGQGLQACIDRTMNDVKAFHPSFRFHRLEREGKLLAYWGTEFDHYINLIFVKPECRNASFMKAFWEHVTSGLPKTFYSAVYSKNRPAVGFYLRRGGELEEFRHEGARVSAFTFNKAGD